MRAITSRVGLVLAAVLPLGLTTGLLMAPSAQAETIYTIADVQQHAVELNCWSAIDGGVYDLTAFIPIHKGGPGVIIAMCGKDGSTTFHRQHGTQSSPATTLARYRIGALGTTTPTPTPTTTPTPAPTPTPTPTTAGTSFTATQVAAHSTEGDCWSAIDTSVYNLTAFIPLHNGGKAVIIALCGKNGTASFHGQHGTSSTPASTLARYRIGSFAGGTFPTPAPTVAAQGTYTWAQVAAHATPGDCWVVINTTVYDLTKFLPIHPRAGVIDPVCGKDGTTLFTTQHSLTATAKLTTLNTYKIGTVTGTATLAALGSYTAAQLAAHSTAANCWVAISGSVYDLSKWLTANLHPGGTAVIAPVCGKDGTTLFTTQHSSTATAKLGVLSTYKIGTYLGGATTTAVVLGNYTLADVQKHASETDCWTVVGKWVYDVTKWIPVHPGGKPVVIAMCGNDGSAMYLAQHSVDPVPASTLATYKIGTFVPTPAAATATTVSAPAAATTSAVKTFTFRQIHRHRTAKNCWSVVNRNVYNLTPWTKRHANHRAFIKLMCGKNGTASFNRNSGSVAKSNTKLLKFFIGTLPASTTTAVPAAAPAAAPAPSTYTMADVAKHGTATDCWSAISGGVYDLTAWVGQHPGGKAAITGICGKDGTSSFNAIHSSSATAKAALAKLQVGTLG
jgi:cytochrome b involved in lipid metabolism